MENKTTTIVLHGGPLDGKKVPVPRGTNFYAKAKLPIGEFYCYAVDMGKRRGDYEGIRNHEGKLKT